MVWVEGNRNPISSHTPERYGTRRLYVDHRSNSSEKRSPQNDRHLGVLIHIQENKIARDDELTHLDWNILQNTHRLLDREIYELNGQTGGLQVR